MKKKILLFAALLLTVVGAMPARACGEKKNGDNIVIRKYYEKHS